VGRKGWFGGPAPAADVITGKNPAAIIRLACPLDARERRGYNRNGADARQATTVG
jgi:hypothetical protein